MSAGAAEAAEARQRTMFGLLLTVDAGDETGFRALLRDMPRGELVVLLRSMSEVVLSAMWATEERPGDVRADLAREALKLASR